MQPRIARPRSRIGSLPIHCLARSLPSSPWPPWPHKPAPTLLARAAGCVRTRICICIYSSALCLRLARACTHAPLTWATCVVCQTPSKLAQSACRLRPASALSLFLYHDYYYLCSRAQDQGRSCSLQRRPQLPQPLSQPDCRPTRQLSDRRASIEASASSEICTCTRPAHQTTHVRTPPANGPAHAPQHTRRQPRLPWPLPLPNTLLCRVCSLCRDARPPTPSPRALQQTHRLPRPTRP